MMHIDMSIAGGRWGGTRGRAALIALAATLAACHPNDVLQVGDIDVARPQAVADSSALPALLAGAIGDFSVAYNGGGDFNQITLSGELSDELINTETFPTRIEVDQRAQQYQTNGSLRDLFYATQQARASAERAEQTFAKFLPNDAGRAEALNLGALTLILMAENYCGAVPISRQLPSGAFEYGAALSTQELLQAAAQKADSALAIATAAGVTSVFGSSATTQTNVAHLLKGRALLDNGDPAGAAAAVGSVPTTFRYIYQHSQTTARQNNGTWGVTWSVGRFGVGQAEGGNGLTYRVDGDTALAGSIKDPRVSNRQRGGAGVGFDGSTPQFMPWKVGKRDTLVVIEDGVEARLIEAEAALRANDYATALVDLNALRSNASLLAQRGYAAGSLPPLTPAVGATAQTQQVFGERAYWLYLTSHRLGDLRRMIRDYGFGAESVFPTGAYFKSGTYGSDVNSPIPQAEDNNPNFDRSACDVTKP